MSNEIFPVSSLTLETPPIIPLRLKAGSSDAAKKNLRPVGRVKSLDALRGLASLWVVLHHSWAATAFAVATVGFIRFTPLRPLLGARPPVILFFVLSGFVLTLACEQASLRSYPAYLVRRFCRIYLPFAVVVILSASAARGLAGDPIPGATALMNKMWDDVSVGMLIRHLLMTGIEGQTGFDTPIWSLVQEMRISIIFPGLVVLISALGWRPTSLIVVSIFLTSWGWLHRLGQDAIGYYAAVSAGASIVLTAFFLLPFVVGILAATYRGHLVAITRWNGVLTVVLWVSVAGGIALPSFSPGMDLVYALSAGGLIVLTLGSKRAYDLLTTRAVQWLGRISYSLYLVHLPVLIVLASLFASIIPFGLIAAIAPVVSLVVATIAYVAIEVPSIRLGRKLASAVTSFTETRSDNSLSE